MEPGGEFNFQHLPNFKFLSLQKSGVRESLMKWSMIDGMSMQAYSFDKPFKKYQEREFLTDFLACPNVVSTLMKRNFDNSMAPMNCPADKVTYSEVKCNLTTLEVFDKLRDNKIAQKSDGRLRKCFPEYLRMDKDETHDAFEIEIFDNLRKLFLSDEDHSEDYIEICDTLSQEERKEFLVILFSHLVIGGSLCQYEDFLDPYLEVTKQLYKDLVAVAAVQKGNDGSGDASSASDGGPELRIISHVYKIHGVKGQKGATGVATDLLFNKRYHNNFFYVIVNPLKQICVTFYHHV